MARFIELIPHEYVNIDVIAMIDIDTERSRVSIYINGDEYAYSKVSTETIEKLKQLLNNN